MATVNFIRYSSQSRAALGKVADYVMQKEKTMEPNGVQLVSGQKCNPQLAAREFAATRDMFHKTSPVWFYHYTQSFHPKENVTGRQAHEIAKEFAARAWPDSEVLIATHIDAQHIHSHFLVNAVCYETGTMLRQGPNTLQHLRVISDDLCMKYELSVLPNSQKKSDGVNTREYRSAVKGESWKFQLMGVVDQCMEHSRSKTEFVKNMNALGYQVRWEDNRKNITYTHPNGQKVRDARLHERKYLKEVMEREFRIRAEIIAGRIEAAQHAAGYTTCAAGGAAAHRDPMRYAGGAGVCEEVHGGYSSIRHDTSGTAEGDLQGASIPGVLRTGGGSAEENDQAAGSNREAQEIGGAEHTGWEREREICFETYPMEHHFGSGALGRAAGAAAQLGRALEQNQNSGFVQDATTVHHHTDHVQRSKEKQKKIALGHKADDHEEEQIWEQTM